jgi:hypothetical protein
MQEVDWVETKQIGKMESCQRYQFAPEQYDLQIKLMLCFVNSGEAN